MEKLGQLHREAQRDRPVGPDRGGHPAVAVGAGLPRRPRAAVQLPRRPVHPAAAGAGEGPGRLMTAGLGVVTGALTKVLGAQVLRDMQTFVAALDTLFGGFRQRAQTTVRAAPGARHRLPGGRRARSRTRCARRRTSSSGWGGADAAGRAGGQPRRPAPPGGLSADEAARRRPERLKRDGPRRRAHGRPAAAARRAGGSWRGRPGWRAVRRRPPARADRGAPRVARPTCTTSTACGWSVSCWAASARDAETGAAVRR